MITYPVDTSKTFTFKLGGEVKRRRPWPREDGGPIETPHPDLVVLEEVTAPLPVFDPATHRIGPGEWEDDHANQTATFVRSIVPLTAEELAERVRQQELDTLRDQAKAVYTDLKNGVGTAGERATRLERVVAWLLKREFSDLD